ncbi:MAG TPA: MFS transporter, partial [Rectinemataceae bacterium]|nr:MFS transporter [Rectinemataceae bacterium]
LAFGVSGDEILAYRLALVIGALFILAAWIPFSLIREGVGRGGAAEGENKGQEKLVEAGQQDGREPTPPPGPGQNSRIAPSLWLKLLLPGFLIGMGAGLTIPYLNLYFKDVFSLEDGAIGAAVAAGQIATFIGMASGPALARRIGKPWAVVGTQMASVPLILVLAWIHSLPLAIFAYLLRQSLMNLATPIQDIFLLEHVPPSRMIFLNAVRTLVWNGSWTISARLSGWIIWKGGFAPSFTVTAILYALGTALFWLFFIYGREAGRKGSPPPAT